MCDRLPCMVRSLVDFALLHPLGSLLLTSRLLAIKIPTYSLECNFMMLRRTCSYLRFHRPKIRSFSTPPPKIQSTLNSSPDHHNSSLATILQLHGFPRSHLDVILSHRHFPATTTPSDMDGSLKTLSLLGLPRESLVPLVSSFPKVLEPGFLKKWHLDFSQLGLTIAPTLIRRILELSCRSMLDLERTKRSLETLRQVGFSNDTLIRVLEELPGVTMNPDVVLDRVRILDAFGFGRSQINRICLLFPRFLVLGVENRLVPLLEEFRGLGFAEEARKAIVDNPRLVLGMDVGEMARLVELLERLKCRVPIKERILANGMFAAALAVKSRVDCLCRHGLVMGDALVVLMREPRLILYEVDEIEEKIGFFCCKMGFSIGCLAEVPDLLGMHLEKQIVPRYRVIEFLRSKGALDLDVDPRHYVKFSRKRFYNMFVKPYPECEEIFEGPARQVKVTARLPAGFWKLFKPSTHPKSEEDVRNTKLFMES